MTLCDNIGKSSQCRLDRPPFSKTKSMRTFNFGKYKGQSLEEIARINPSYFRWAMENVDGFRSYAIGIKPRPRSCHSSFRRRTEEPTHKPELKKPDDEGSDVVNNRGEVIGRRRYFRSQTSDSWEKHTIYPDGSGTWHCGGPCGHLYYDKFGNT